MTDNTINNKVNINLDATFGISDEKAADLVSTLNTKLIGDGIESVSYANGQLEVSYEKGKEADVDALAAKLQGLAFSTDEMKKLLGDVKDVTFKSNSDGTITLTTNEVSQSPKPISDFDIRELMKLLIVAFAELMTADRERALNILTATVAAFETKIAKMEIAAQEEYKSAIASAIGSIVSGAISVTMAVGGGACSGLGLHKSHSSTSGYTLTGKSMNQQQIDKTKRASEHWSNAGQIFGNMSMPAGKITEGVANIDAAAHGLAKTEANIESTEADALLEVLRTAIEQFQKGSTSLQEFISKVINVMMQIDQAIGQAMLQAARMS